MLDDQMKWFAAHFPDSVIPRELLRRHLTEALSPAGVDAATSSLGNRTAACQINGQILLLSCTGSVGQTVTLNALTCHQATVKV